MVDNKICYSEVYDLYYLKKSFILLKSDIHFKESYEIEMWKKLFKSLKMQNYRPKFHKKISWVQVGKKMC